MVTISPDLKKQMVDMMGDLQELKMKKSTSPLMQESEQKSCDICGEVGHIVDECPRMTKRTYEGGAEVSAA